MSGIAPLVHFKAGVEEKVTNDLTLGLEECDNRLRSIHLAMGEMRSTQQRISVKVQIVQADIETEADLNLRRETLTVELEKVEALAFVDGLPADVTTLKQSLAEVTRLLRAAGSRAKAARVALEILNTKNAKCLAALTRMSADLVEAERKWLKARQDILFEEFRRRFDQLHDTVALLLALEVHPSFDGPNSWTMVRPGSDLLGRLASALPYNGPRNYTPTWVHENNRFKFPGFAAAQEKLAEELSQTHPSSETEK